MGIRSAKTELLLDVRATQSTTLNSGDTSDVTIRRSFLDLVMATGVDANQADHAWMVEDHELTNNVLTLLFGPAGTWPDQGAGTNRDALGQSISWSEIVFLAILQTEGPGQVELDPTNNSIHFDWIPQATVGNGGALRAGGAKVWFQPDADGFPVGPTPLNESLWLRARNGDAKVSVFVIARLDDERSSSSLSTSSTVSSSST